ncbi:MAG: hypothetical protein NVS2B5_14060 [Beijerinckiaceae bacterium]
MPLQSTLAIPLPSPHGPRLTRSDTRSDGQTREVAFANRSVLIARRLAGIAMHVRVPLSSYQGVVLSLAGAPGGGAVHMVGLKHRDPDLSIPLCEAADAEEIALRWTEWARSLSLPRLVERTPGVLENVDSATLPRPQPRRRGSSVNRRRPRFARRRKMGALKRLAIAYRDEREIICYE